MSKSSSNPLVRLLEAGQSFWMDSFSRGIVEDGTLARMIREDGLRGITSNPDILEKAINGTDRYDREVRRLAAAGKSVAEIYETIAVDDIQAGADVLRPVYERSSGIDGYISLEVSPYMACDADGTVEEARRLWTAVNRPNVMIKVPATPAGLLAIRQLIAEGINVNVTLIFSLSAYEQVMEAHIAGLQDRSKAKLPIDRVVSVASFFISRLDAVVDRHLGFRIGASLPRLMSTEPLASNSASPVLFHRPGDLLGKAAIACAKLAYANFRRRYAAADFRKLAARGARVQRPLWASTSTKNPLYPPMMYVEELIGFDTVNTMPQVTLDAFRKRGTVKADSILNGLDDARSILGDLASLDIDIEAICAHLLEDGIQKFNQPFDKLLASLSAKRLGSLSMGSETQEELLDKKCSAAVGAVLASLSEARLNPRLYGKDGTLFSGGDQDPALHARILNRLGWLDAPAFFIERVEEIQKVALGIRESGFTDVVLLGMGGSSLCPEVCRDSFGSGAGWPRMHVLDTTEAVTVGRVVGQLDLKKSLFISASKSGGTIETATLAKFFHHLLESAGVTKPCAHFLAITDPGTALEKLASELGYRHTFLNPPDIGGRFSALSYFGLVPMALLGMDVRRILKRALALGKDGPDLLNSAVDAPVRLGATLATLATMGRDKLTLLLSPRIKSLGLWIEQLVAESTGKRGHGILPVDGEPLLPPKRYGTDRVFVSISVAGDQPPAQATLLGKLTAAGHPVVRVTLSDIHDLGAEFLRWELATAVMGAVLRINPFDEPNVTESKENTSAILQQRRSTGRLPVPAASAKDGDIEISVTESFKKAAGLKTRSGVKEILSALTQVASGRDFFSLLAFVPPLKTSKALAAIRGHVAKTTGVATTLGFGPRYLHSTGQHHKGGPNDGVFVVITHEPDDPIAVSGTDLTFGGLCRAQALGDFRSLEAHGRRAVLIHLGKDSARGVRRLQELVCGF
jgi:transaldolase/glucose-6-phosphate isomerase